MLLSAAEARWAACAAAARRRAAFLPEDRPPAGVPAAGRAGAGGTSSAATSGARDTSLARIAALTVIFAPVITLARRSARPASTAARRTAGRPACSMMLARPIPATCAAVGTVQGWRVSEVVRLGGS
jgi:hypothetical protein